jgi:outer membrane protein OmpA-like peptidoglycan-associated protein
MIRENAPPLTRSTPEIGMFKSVKGPGMLSLAFLLIGVTGCGQQWPTQSTYVEPTQNATAQAVALPEAPDLACAWYQIFFDINTVDIDAQGHMVIKNAAFVALNDEMTRVTVISRTNRDGDTPLNLALSKLRAGKVRDALIIAGVLSSRIDTQWTGQNRQAASTGDETNQNRTHVVDITVIKIPPPKI